MRRIITNTAILLGRLTKDPEVHYTSSNKTVCNFTLAVDRPFTNAEGKREADFIPVVIWGKGAETAGNSLQKGHRVLVEGRIQVRNYDAKDGTKRYVTEIVCGGVTFIEKKNQGAATPSGAGMSSFGQAVPFADPPKF